MIRKLVFSLLILASIALIIFYLYQQNTGNHPSVSDTVISRSAVSLDALAILDISNVSDAWDEVKNGNLLYEELVGAGVLDEFDDIWSEIDSNVFSNKEWEILFQNQSLHISIHPSGSRYDYLLSMDFNQEISNASLKQKLETVIKGDIQWSNKTYDEAEILVLNREGREHYCTYHKGYLLWSPSSIVIENSIRSINNSTSILDENDFAIITATASNEKNIHAYLDYSRLPQLSSLYVSGIDNKLLNNKLGGWSEFDISMKPNSLLLNGFLLCQDSLNYFLQCFDDQDADRVRVTEVMPTNIAWYMHANISDPIAYGAKTISYWNKLGKGGKLKKNRDALVEKLHWDPFQLQSLMDGEIALAILEPKEQQLNEDYCFFMKVGDEARVIQVLDGLLEAYKTNTGNKTSRARYRSYLYWSIGQSDLIPVSYGPLFHMIDKPVFTLIEGYLVVSNAVKTNKKIVNQYLSDQTLAKDIHYNNFMANTSNESNLSFYTNIARSPYYFKNILNENSNDFIDEKIDVFRQFQATSMQFEKSNNGKYYQTFYCKYNPVYKNETSSLWELPLDTSMANQPVVVINHKNQQQELFVQDDRMDLYLISNTGKTLWKKKFEEEIIGAVEQVDCYQNKKLQMLFLTKSYIHLLDRNGKTVEGFPIQLPVEATSELAVMDYDGNHRFRLLVGCADGNIYNFNIKGKKVEGWEYEADDNPIVGDIKHFKIDTKDYVLCQTQNGGIKVINRKGELRYRASDSLHVEGDYLLIKRKDIENTTLIHVDNDGRIMRSQLNGKRDRLVENKHEMLSLYHGNDKQGLVAVDGDMIRIYDDKGEVVSRFETEEALRKVQYHTTDDGPQFLSGISEDNLLYLYSVEGQLQSGFPLTGSSFRTMTNLNNDNLQDVIIGDEEGMLYIYSLESN